MRYLFLLWGDEAGELALSDDERWAIVEAHGTFTQELRDAGRTVTGEVPGPAGEGKVLRRTHRAPSVTDGPFLETKEQLGGFYIIDCPDLDDAIAIAGRVPMSPGLAVEIRSILEFSD
jgi:hypothetical protein